MCLGIPGKVLQIKDNKAKVKMQDHNHWLDLSLIDEEVNIGDYLLAYQSAAINKVSKVQAKEIIKLIGNVK
ncbi:HypC/HybG/HupF family hydrogenase formation chaperone [Patescibacteria group bacterium]